MAGDGVLYEWDDNDMQAMIARAIGNIKDMTPILKPFSESMVLRTEYRFENQEAPDGSGWVKLDPSTISRKVKLKKRDKILQYGGDLIGSIRPYSDRNSAGLMSKVDYAAIHNRGGMAGRNHSVMIPKREFLGFNDADIKEFQDTIADFVVLGRK